MPKSHVYRILRSGEVREQQAGGSGPTGWSNTTKSGFRRYGWLIRGTPALIPLREFDILYEDDAFLAINKPAGMAVHGGSGVSFGVIESLRRARPEARLLELAHRLDRETSGILLVAKKRSALTALHDAFRDGGMDKRYYAMVSGRWMNPVQHIKLALTKYLTESGERRVGGQRGQGSALHRRTSGPLAGLQPAGRAHQDRAHAPDPLSTSRTAAFPSSVTRNTATSD